MDHLAAVQSAGIHEPLLPMATSPGYGISISKPGRALPRPADVEAAVQSGGLWAAARPVFEEPPTAFPQSSPWDTVVNLTNAILGAGLLALPRAYAGLGVLGGVALTAAVGLMTHASVVLMLRRTERSGRLTYAAVVEHAWGRWAGAAVRFSVVVGSAGFLVLYLVVVADLLVGSAEFSGVIPDLWPSLPDPLPWYLQRTAVLTWVTLLVAPALVPKTLGEVALVSVLKIFCTLLCVAALLVLLAALAMQGRLPPVYWLPDPSFYGDGPLERMRNFLAVVPVIMTAFVCHMSVHPCVQDLRDYTPRRMRTAVAGAVAISGAVYSLAGVAGFCVWGVGVQGDVLSELGVDFVAEALGGRVGLAMAFVATVKVSMAASMVLSWPITLWPMRQDMLEMLGECFGATPLSPSAYYSLTYASLAAAYAAALAVQSAYWVVGMVGATLGTAMAFIFPGMLALRDEEGGPAYRGFGWALLLAGGVLTALGVASTDSG